MKPLPVRAALSNHIPTHANLRGTRPTVCQDRQNVLSALAGQRTARDPTFHKARSGTTKRGRRRRPSRAHPSRPRQHGIQYETDLSSVLAFAPREVPLEILQIADERARSYCSHLGLDPGDRITRHDGLKDDVLLSLEDGRRVRLALPIALLVEVEPALRS
jgi:hypothetical protein